RRDKGTRFAVLHTPVDVAVPEFSGSAVNEVYWAPLHEAGEHHTFIVLGVSPRLAKDAHYRRFFQQIAAQLRADRSRVLEAVRRSAVELERRNLLEHAPVATALLVGPDHLFELANPLYRQMVGRPDLVGKTYLEAFPELKGTQLPAVLDQVYATGEPFATSEQLVAIDRGEGKTEDCYFRFNLEPVRDQHGQVYGMMAVAVEVTEQVVGGKSVV